MRLGVYASTLRYRMNECGRFRWEPQEHRHCGVQPEHLANRFKDAILPQVLATPVMILIMENAALNAIKPFLDVGESAVGTAVDVKHFAATPVGHEVRATAEVVEGKRVDFKVSASDGNEVIGSGIHQRIVIDLGSFNERLAKKSR